MYNESLPSVYLLDLKKVLELMVIQNRIKEQEMLSILKRAGLEKIGDDKWIDEEGSTYKKRGNS